MITARTWTLLGILIVVALGSWMYIRYGIPQTAPVLLEKVSTTTKATVSSSTAGLVATAKERKIATSNINASYTVGPNGVYCNNDRITDADPITFTYVAGTYAKDKAHVWTCIAGLGGVSDDSSYDYALIVEADPATFQVLRGGYLKDAVHVYYVPYRGFTESDFKPLSGVDNATFTVTLDGNYARDASHVYFDGSTVPDANSHSFTSLGSSDGISSTAYGNDMNHAYCESRIIPGASPVILVLPYNSFVEDGHSLYLCTTFVARLDESNLNTFRVDTVTGYDGHVYRVARDQHTTYAVLDDTDSLIPKDQWSSLF